MENQDEWEMIKNEKLKIKNVEKKRREENVHT